MMPPTRSNGPVREPALFSDRFFLVSVCARNLKAAASLNHLASLKPLAHALTTMHHNSG
jgi:hypothetical protein